MATEFIIIMTNFGMSLHIYLYFVYASSEYSSESAHLQRLA